MEKPPFRRFGPSQAHGKKLPLKDDQVQFKRFGPSQAHGKKLPLKDSQMQYLPRNPDPVAEGETVLLPATLEGETVLLPAIMEQDTAPLPAIHKPTFLRSLLPEFAQRIVTAMLIRAQESEPEEWSYTLRQKAVKSQARALGWLPMLTLINAFGMCLAADASFFSIYTSTDQENYLWLGLLLIFAPSFLRLLSPIASRLERIGILCSVGISMYLVKVILSPLGFSFIDEYFHWRTVGDILSSGHLFTDNSMLPVGPSYPGLEIVTDAFSSLSGLNSFTAGLIVIGIARFLMILCIFAFFEYITKSPRIAGIATIIYMTNLGFFFFNALFVYETLGLALEAFIIFALARIEIVANGGRGLLLTAWMAIGALTITHHVSDFFLIGLLILWAIVYKYLRQPVLQSNMVKTALIGILLPAAWVIFAARPVIGYLFSPVKDGLAQLTDVLAGSSNARHLFADAVGGHPAPVWERLVMALSIGLTTLGIPFGYLCIWQRFRHRALPTMLSLLALCYPVSQAFRLTKDPDGLSDRFTPYAFIGVSFVLAVLIIQMWPARKLKWKQAILITSVASLVFLGATVLGSGPTWTLMPGSYTVGDDASSITPEGIQAATWTLSHLGPNNRVSTDRTNRLLMGTYGDQRIVTVEADKVYVSPVFYSTQFGPWAVSLLQSAQVHYLVVDLRLSTSLPLKGVYFDAGEPDSYNLTRPISRQALTKFDTVSQINRIFDSGNIVIYDVGALVNAPKKP